MYVHVQTHAKASCMQFTGVHTCTRIRYKHTLRTHTHTHTDESTCTWMVILFPPMPSLPPPHPPHTYMTARTTATKSDLGYRF